MNFQYFYRVHWNDTKTKINAFTNVLQGQLIKILKYKYDYQTGNLVLTNGLKT